MIREFSIKNYKSILDLTLDLGRINLFIGENGCGKTNILEAMAMAAAAVTDRVDAEELYNRGVRVAKPEITRSSFAGVKQDRQIGLDCTVEVDLGKKVAIRLAALSDDMPSSTWFEVGQQPLTGAVGARRDVLLDTMRKFESTGQVVPRTLVDAFTKSTHSTAAMREFTRLLSPSRMRLRKDLAAFLIYNANQLALRGLLTLSRKEPLGINGENLDVAIASLGDKGIHELLERSALIRWVERIFTDPEDKLKFEGYKLGRSTSTLYFRDRFMRKRANIFSAENANEGILHALFYLTLFISDRTPAIFGIDNIETALNPRLCRNLVKQLGELAKVHDKQALITTHNPAALDGLDLLDDDQRLFVVARNDAGQTVANRIKLKPETKGKESRLMLSEMWMRGQLGGIPLEF